MKRPETRIKELRKELSYHQEMNRVDLFSYHLGCMKIKQIAEKMRRIQQENKPKVKR